MQGERGPHPAQLLTDPANAGGAVAGVDMRLKQARGFLSRGNHPDNPVALAVLSLYGLETVHCPATEKRLTVNPS